MSEMSAIWRFSAFGLAQSTVDCEQQSQFSIFLDLHHSSITEWVQSNIGRCNRLGSQKEEEEKEAKEKAEREAEEQKKRNEQEQAEQKAKQEAEEQRKREEQEQAEREAARNGSKEGDDNGDSESNDVAGGENDNQAIEDKKNVIDEVSVQ